MDSKTKEILQKFASQKVELGMIQEGAQSAKNLVGIAEELKGIKKALARDMKRIEGYASDGMQEFKYLQNVVSNIKKINKEMGIGSIPELKAMEKAMDDFSETNKLKI
jgi:hypothetical protein|tara:strand:- start:181 stop:504 length:324 start_codon:yes stop_codon:yes gene_type:complete